ncbi:hypothetical protein GCM10010145_08900 [Streptomyces ruber]|uniref:Uncharacterized protein n=2 Tax=Streptomyces TaxID=1883 RepID=A0A918ENF6_9ACTN|nr:hypothetical protein [Streptomyces ruber]GGQ42351.1 hypothetical protein GCM10010145_08900 [Streptomyces ruber]
MKSEDTPFVGGPLDGRVLPVLLGITGHPPKTYRVPVPAAAGGEPAVLVYRRVPRPQAGRFALAARWQYEYDPDPAGRAGGPRWPWSRNPGGGRPEGAKPGDTPGGPGGTADE